MTTNPYFQKYVNIFFIHLHLLQSLFIYFLHSREYASAVWLVLWAVSYFFSGDKFQCIPSQNVTYSGPMGREPVRGPICGRKQFYFAWLYPSMRKQKDNLDLVLFSKHTTSLILTEYWTSLSVNFPFLPYKGYLSTFLQGLNVKLFLYIFSIRALFLKHSNKYKGLCQYTKNRV